MEKDTSYTSKADEFIQMFKKGEEFTKELLKENEKLRYKIVELEGSIEKSVDNARTRLYEERIKLLEDDLNSLKEKYSEV